MTGTYWAWQPDHRLPLARQLAGAVAAYIDRYAAIPRELLYRQPVAAADTPGVPVVVAAWVPAGYVYVAVPA